MWGGILLGIVPFATCAGTLAGQVTFPGGTVPDAVIFARNVETQAIYEHVVRHGDVRYSLELPAGRYWIFVRPDEPGLAELYGAHTEYSVCSRQTSVATEQCTDHALRTVEVGPQAVLDETNIDDWLLSDQAAAELDRTLGGPPASADRAELGRPRFSEYRVPSMSAPSDVALNLGSDPRMASFAQQLENAAHGGSNFSGSFAVARLDCGPNCDTLAFIDLRSGAVTFPDQLSRVERTLPCRDDRVLVFRDDSRLLEYTHREGDGVVTDYLLWDATQRRFSTLAQYRRSLDRFCARVPPAAP